MLSFLKKAKYRFGCDSLPLAQRYDTVQLSETPKHLYDALLKFQADESVRLSKLELQEWLKKYGSRSQ
jgi:hypothetical protein